MVEAVGGSHLLGKTDADDSELRERGVNRIYDVYLADEHFETLETWMGKALGELGKESVTAPELFDFLGSVIEDRCSILKRAHEKGVPVFCPAFGDSIAGLHTWLHSQTNRIVVDSVGELQRFLDICYSSKRSGVFIVGGGVPKNYILQSMLMTGKGFDYAIQLTMDRPETGGLSGATLEEAKSWGKLRADTRHVTVYCDATIALPVIVAHALGSGGT
jgi:deoxyhypusine synthase